MYEHILKIKNQLGITSFKDLLQKTYNISVNDIKKYDDKERDKIMPDKKCQIKELDRIEPGVKKSDRKELEFCQTRVRSI